MSATITNPPPITSPVRKMTVEEYLAFEHDAETKHEYVNGEVIEMAGASINHNRIASDTHTQLSLAFRAEGEEVLNSDQRIRVDDNGPFYYPDITLVREAAIIDTDQCLRNPYAIIEVLSDSTAATDRDEKFRAYRRMPSLRHYILISQTVVRVEHFERLPGDIWALVGEHERLSDSLTFAESTVHIPLAEIYRRVSLPEP